MIINKIAKKVSNSMAILRNNKKKNKMIMKREY